MDRLIGKIIKEIYKETDDEIRILCTDNTHWILHHLQDCCEDVYIEDICGDLKDLIGSPVVVSECIDNKIENPGGYDSATWTFIRIGTSRALCTIRFFGTSNGYYSESADLYPVNENWKISWD